MKIKKPLLIAAAVVVVVVAGLGVLVATGVANGLFGRSHEYAYPPCEQLPAKAAVTQAITQHTSLVDQLKRVGGGVDVVAGTPCADPGKAVVTVKVTTDDEESAVNDILDKSTGFGAPATIDRQ